MQHNCARFAGKVAVLSASTNGIGLAIARRLGQEKAKVVVSSRKLGNVTRAVDILQKENIEAIGVQCHISNSEERAQLIEKAVDHFGGIDLLVVNAGVNPHIGRMLDCPEAAWDKSFDVNVKGAFLLTKEVIPLMKKRKGGNIVYISTISAYKDTFGLGAYATSKSCLTRLAKTFGAELADDNIRVNCIAPGPIDTMFMKEYGKLESFQRVLQNEVPMKRFGQPEEVAGPAAFILSDDASYITGETIIVSGGVTTRH